MRIAIYSRKSKWTGRGDSVENQVSMCREFISRSIEHADTAEIWIYEDEGFSGKNTRRPQFQRMMEDIHQKSFDYLVCYRLDRLGRNLIDLATLVEELNRREITFISMKEHFDTSTPMGKAMLYFAGVLAQMEREQIAERVRDNMMMLAKSGRWLGGNTPLGFTSTEEKTVLLDGKTRKTWYLQENAAESSLVRLIFGLYLEKQSLVKVAEYLQVHEIYTRKYKEYTVDAVRDILRNPVYCQADREGYEYFRKLGCQICTEESRAGNSRGFICYAKTTAGHKENPPEKWILAVGKHQGMIAGKDFVKAQQLLENNKRKTNGHRIRNEIALLPGILFCSCGCAMRPKYYAVKQTDTDGNRRFSYLCPRKTLTHGQVCGTCNIQGNTLDQQIWEAVLEYLEKMINWNEILENTCRILKETSSHRKPISEAEILERQLNEKKKQIENLLYTLSSSTHTPPFIRQIEQEILKLQEQCLELEKRCTTTETEETAEKPISRNFTSLRETAPYFTTRQKRELIKAAVHQITWDGKKLIIVLNSPCADAHTADS